MTKYAHIENNTITGVYNSLPENWKNVSNLHLLDDPVILRSLGWRIVADATPSYNPSTQLLSNPIYTIQNDEVIESFIVDDIVNEITPTIEQTDEILATIKANEHIRAMEDLRVVRNSLLVQTDYTQLADVIVMHGEQLAAAYVTYRQSLRDLANTYESNLDFTNTGNIDWPTKPESM